MRITITAAQRNALYEEFEVLLTGIDGIWRSVEEKDFERADQLARVYADALTFVVTDLGWGPGTGNPIALKTDPEIVRRVVEQLRRSRETWRGEEKQELARAEGAASRSQEVVNACEDILRQLDEDPN